MALGKRVRTLTSHQDSRPHTKRPRVAHVNDENVDPLSVAHDVQDSSCLLCNDLEDPFSKSPKNSHASETHRVKSLEGSRGHIPFRKTEIYTDPVLIRKGQENNPKVRIYKTEYTTVEQGPNQTLTPQTPRHRDALSKKIPITPRRLLNSVTRISTPRTPRTSRTPVTPVTPSSLSTVYHDARQSFVRSADPGRLVGRDAERQELETFIRAGIDHRAGGCLYVSGPPGTGKSALVREVCQQFPTSTNLRKASINCMSVKNPGDVYRVLFDDLVGRSDGREHEQDSDLFALMAPKKKSTGPTYLVTLDEIDHLLELDLEVLYSLFELGLRRTSRLILIGIANALDLTDRFLPRLKARNLKPQLLPFLPYTAPQVASVITTKLRTLLAKEGVMSDYVPFVHPTAIELCSKKVASQTGDLRKAFDIIHRSLSLVEIETKQKYQNEICTPNSPSKSPLSENSNLSSPLKDRTLAASLATITPMTAPRVTIAHVARVTASALSHGTSQRLKTLNLQQKAALCALVSSEKRKQSSQWRLTPDTPSKSPINSTTTIQDLYRMYSSLCKRDNTLHPLTADDFCDVIGGLETLGLVGEGDAKGIAKRTSGKKAVKWEDRRISCWVSEKELESCLDGASGAILRGLLTYDG